MLYHHLHCHAIRQCNTFKNKKTKKPKKYNKLTFSFFTNTHTIQFYPPPINYFQLHPNELAFHILNHGDVEEVLNLRRTIHIYVN